ncbi:MAG: hypothetical protein HW416_446 [Chloroflexi bacterium]|nr:hypothetical protein [Chloroflexota bacterium]
MLSAASSVTMDLIALSPRDHEYSPRPEMEMLGSRNIIVLAVVALVGCASPGPGASGGQAAPGGGRENVPRQTKTLTIGQINTIPAYGPWDFSNTSGGGSAIIELHSLGLKTSTRTGGGDEPRLAAKLPSFDDGTMVIQPDGRLVVTWTLRQDVKFHDGHPMTADDVAFSWRLIMRPDLLSSRRDYWTLATNVEAVDSSTIRMTWPTTFFKALDMGADKVWIFPKHILGEPLDTIKDRDAFLSQPFFTTQYLNTGPFRVVDWGMGEVQVLEAFDGYFLGRPRIDRVIIRSIGDVNTMAVNLKSRALDMLSEKTLSLNLFFDLRDEWARTGEGIVPSRQENWRYIWFQFHPEYAKPLELAQDVHLRRGLFHSLDRDGLRELLLPGVEYTSADTFMPESDARTSIVGRPFARYALDQRRALQEFEEGGWRRAPDGRMMNRVGQQVQFELRGNPPDGPELAFVSAGWRELGMDVVQYQPPEALGRDNEFKSKYPSMETRARSTGDEIFVSFDGRLGSSAENRWQGANTSHYANPSLDLLIDRLESTIDSRQQGLVLKEMGEILADDVPALATYYRAIFGAVVKGVKALDDYSTGATGTMARNSHLWDRD